MAACLFPFSKWFRGTSLRAQSNNLQDLQDEVKNRINNIGLQSYDIGVLGEKRCGRHTLICRFKNLEGNRRLSRDEVKSYAWKRLAHIDLSQRPDVPAIGTAILHFRFVPPDVNPSGVNFFSPVNGDILRCHALMMCIDLSNFSSTVHCYRVISFLPDSACNIPPLMIIGNKVDLAQEPRRVPRRWGEEMAAMNSARGYYECSGKVGTRAGEVLDNLLRILI